jgi:hypothetical protein
MSPDHYTSREVHCYRNAEGSFEGIEEIDKACSICTKYLPKTGKMAMMGSTDSGQLFAINTSSC